MAPNRPNRLSPRWSKDVIGSETGPDRRVWDPTVSRPLLDSSPHWGTLQSSSSTCERQERLHHLHHRGDRRPISITPTRTAARRRRATWSAAPALNRAPTGIHPGGDEVSAPERPAIGSGRFDKPSGPANTARSRRDRFHFCPSHLNSATGDRRPATIGHPPRQYIDDRLCLG